MYQSNTNSSQPSVGLVQSLKDWWETCPLFTRFLIYFCGVLFILTRISSLETMLFNIPSKTIGEFQVTRLLFSPFCFWDLSELILAFLAYLPLLANQEKTSGTLAAIFDFIAKNLQVNLFYIVVCYLLAFFSRNFIHLPAYGLWGIFFVHLTEICLKEPDGFTPFLFTNFPIRNTLYPLLLAILFSVISNFVRLDILVACVTGFLNIRFLNVIYYSFFNPEKIMAWENSSAVIWLKSFPNFISYGQLSGPLINENDNSNYPPIGGNYGSSDGRRSSGLFEGIAGRRESENKNKSGGLIEV